MKIFVFVKEDVQITPEIHEFSPGYRQIAADNLQMSMFSVCLNAVDLPRAIRFLCHQ